MAELNFGDITTPEESAFKRSSLIDSNHPLAAAFDRSDKAGGVELHVTTDTPKSVINFLRKYAKQEGRGVRVKVTETGVAFRAADKRKSSGHPNDE
jgi:hypothetical protein